MAVTYSVSSIGTNSITLNVYGSSGYYIRAFYRLSSTSSGSYTSWTSGSSSTKSITISGLSQNTTYVVNVTYNTSKSQTGASWCDSYEVTTRGQTEVTYYYRIRYIYGSSIIATTNGSDSSSSGYITVSASDTTAPSGYAKNGTYDAGGTGCTWNSSGSYWRVTATNSSARAYCNVYLTAASVTYYYRIRYWYGSTEVQTTNGSDSSTTGYITVNASDTTAPTGYQKNGTYSAGGTGCEWHSTGEYWKVSATSSSSRADCNVGLDIADTTLTVYDYYSGTSHYRGQYTIPYGSSFNVSTYVDEPSGYEYDHSECPQGTTVTTVTMNGNKTLWIYYTPLTYQLNVYDYYGGATHYRDSYTLDAGYTFNVSTYVDEPSGYEYDHSECPVGTTVTSITMTSNKTLTIFYVVRQPTTPTATFTVGTITPNSIEITANITNTLTYSDNWYLAYSTDSSFSTYQTVQGSGTSLTTTVTGLSNHTTYYFKVVNVYRNNYAWSSNSTNATTRYAYFVWDNNNNIANRRPTAAEWLRLASFIETVKSTTISHKTEIVANNTLSHDLFNEMASAVNYNTAVGLGDRIYITTLNGLRDKANENA